MSRNTRSAQALPSEVADAVARLGKRIRQARIARGMTLSEMAAKVFVTTKTLRRVETGDPSASVAVLASALLVLGRASDFDHLMADDRILAMRLAQRAPRRAR